MDEDPNLDEFDEEGEDVTQLVGLLKGVRADNMELRRNFESLKGLHLHLNDDHKQLQARYHALYEERVTVERQYQALCESWRVELEDKQKQFEHVKAQILGPRDLELMRIAMMEKVEAPFRSKCDHLAKEAELAQQNFVRQRREFEELQSAHRGLGLQTQRERELLAAEYTTNMTDLRDRLAAMGQTQAKLAQAESKGKVAEREKAELVFQLTKLKEEIQELRRAKEQASVARGSVELRVERKVKAIQAEELQLSGLVETLTRKNRHLQKELADAHRSNEDMFDQRMRLKGAEAALQSQLDSQRKQIASDLASQEEQHLAAARSLEDKVLALRDELHGKERQIAEMHINHQEQMTGVVESHGLRLEEVDQDHAKRARELRDLNLEMSARVETLKDSLDECRRELGDAQHKLQREQDNSSRQTERLQAQLADALRQVSAREAEAVQLKQALEGMKGEMLRMELSHGQLMQRNEDLELQKGRLNDESQQLSAAKNGVSKAYDDLRRQLDQERDAHQEQAEQQRQSFAVDKSAMTRRYQANVKEASSKQEAETKRLRRKLKAAEGMAAQLGEELADLRLRCHELEAIGDQYISRFSATHDVRALPLMLPAHPALNSDLGQPAGRHGGAEGGVAARHRPQDAALLKDMASLQLRQQEYLKAARGLAV